jgi:hypothetical protein
LGSEFGIRLIPATLKAGKEIKPYTITNKRRK